MERRRSPAPRPTRPTSTPSKPPLTTRCSSSLTVNCPDGGAELMSGTEEKLRQYLKKVTADLGQTRRRLARDGGAVRRSRWPS
ncbi:polyketide synthase docking domain-containing protein [Streptomyces sp. Mo3]|uniref:polyketide synthase docking domain-containing protein n=1 Tax=Streptomyces sp. Mo3 TaxID=3161190 RepID=UPI0039F003D9